MLHVLDLSEEFIAKAFGGVEGVDEGVHAEDFIAGCDALKASGVVHARAKSCEVVIGAKCADKEGAVIEASGDTDFNVLAVEFGKLGVGE